MEQYFSQDHRANKQQGRYLKSRNLILGISQVVIIYILSAWDMEREISSFEYLKGCQTEEVKICYVWLQGH